MSHFDYSAHIPELTSWLEANLRGLKWKGDEGQGLCPFHDDQNPSFSVNRRKGTWYCHACRIGGGVKELASRLGVEPPAFLMPKKEKAERGQRRKIVAEYYYTDERGKVLFKVCRTDPKGFFQLRPDGKGRWSKNLAGVRRVPYRLPQIIEAVKRGEPVFIVEGEKDAENLVALGLEATTNSQGAGKWPSDPDFNKCFTGADVVILPDNDEPGRRHALKVASVLHPLAKSIKIVDLPELPPKGDISDWLIAGHTKEELLFIVGQTPLWEPTPGEGEEPGDGLPPIYDAWKELLAQTRRYCVDAAGYLCYRKFLPDGNEELVPIANFLARPIREIVRDDGAETQVFFELEGLLAGGQPLPPVVVPAKDFCSMSWVPERWGLSANLEPRSGSKDLLRHCVQSLASAGVSREVIYAHLGWRRINDRWFYLHAGGSVPDSNEDTFLVDLTTEGLGRYSLPPAAEPEVIKEAVAFTAQTLAVAPLEITVPLFCLVHLAPLCGALRQVNLEPAFVLWLQGPTGSMKSTLAALFLSFFGDFTAKTLPASFKDTPNSLEKKAFLTKDCLLVIDDFHPVASRDDARRMQATAQQILRAYGDRVGRGRMRADTTLRPSYPPRGVCLITGEDLPDVTQSGLARLLAVELRKDQVNVDLLSTLQRNASKLSLAMAGFLHWLAPQLDELPAKLRSVFMEYRQKASAGAQHARIPEVVAWLYLGFWAQMEFAISLGVVRPEDRDQLLGKIWEILLRLAEEHGRRIEEDKPARRFIGLLRELLASGAVHVVDIRGSGLAGGVEPGFIGWQDDDWFYLLPDTTYKAVSQFCQAQGSQFPVSLKTLLKHLEAEGFIRTTAEEAGRGHRTVRITVNGRRCRVMQLRKDIIDG